MKNFTKTALCSLMLLTLAHAPAALAQPDSQPILGNKTFDFVAVG